MSHTTLRQGGGDAMGHAPALIDHLAGLVRLACRKVRAWRRNVDQREELRGLDDHMLAARSGSRWTSTAATGAVAERPAPPYRLSSRIAASRPSSVSGNMRSAMTWRTMRIDVVKPCQSSGTGFSHTALE